MVTFIVSPERFDKEFKLRIDKNGVNPVNWYVDEQFLYLYICTDNETYKCVLPKNNLPFFITMMLNRETQVLGTEDEEKVSVNITKQNGVFDINTKVLPEDEW